MNTRSDSTVPLVAAPAAPKTVSSPDLLASDFSPASSTSSKCPPAVTVPAVGPLGTSVRQISFNTMALTLEDASDTCSTARSLSTEQTGQGEKGAASDPKHQEDVTVDAEECIGLPLVPLLWDCVDNKQAVALPLGVLLLATVGLFVPGGGPCAPWYPILYAVLALASPLVVAAWLTLARRPQLRRLCCPGAVPGDRALTVVHACARPLGATPQEQVVEGVGEVAAPENNDPLAFMRRDIEQWTTSRDGWILIDPNPYSAQHDFFMRKQIQSGVRKVLGVASGRPVPAVNKKGEQSIVVLAIDDYFDPADSSNHVFSGRFRFQLQDPSLLTMKKKMAQGQKLAEVCRVFDKEPLTHMIVDAQGVIQYVNQPGATLFGWARSELVGRNVTCLMAESVASSHDAFLRAYRERVAAAAARGAKAQSTIVGSGRDFMAKTKNNGNVRVFVTIDHVDLSSGPPTDFLFHVAMVHITEASINTGRSRGSRRLSSSSSVGGHVICRKPLKNLIQRTCTVVLVVVQGMSQTTRQSLQRSYDEVLKLVNEGCQRQRGVIHGVVGDQVVLSFNSALLANSSHRSNAAHFMAGLHTAWQYSTLCRILRLQTAATSREFSGAQWEAHHVLITNAVDICLCMVRAAMEGQVRRGVICGTLYDELMYSWTCRPLNEATLLPHNSGSSMLQMFELLEMKKLPSDEWMYQISTTADMDDPYLRWQLCWDELHESQPDYAQAHVLLQEHLEQHPQDETAQWLQAVVAQPRWPQAVEWAGTLKYRLRFRRWVEDAEALGEKAPSTVLVTLVDCFVSP